MLHQDLHGDNILRARREAWLAIDPKPLVGERELSLAPIIPSYEFGHSRADVVGRLDVLSTALRLDRERCRLGTRGEGLGCLLMPDIGLVVLHGFDGGWPEVLALLVMGRGVVCIPDRVRQSR